VAVIPPGGIGYQAGMTLVAGPLLAPSKVMNAASGEGAGAGVPAVPFAWKKANRHFESTAAGMLLTFLTVPVRNVREKCPRRHQKEGEFLRASYKTPVRTQIAARFG
jgi:hypothetical protein